MYVLYTQVRITIGKSSVYTVINVIMVKDVLILCIKTLQWSVHKQGATRNLLADIHTFL